MYGLKLISSIMIKRREGKVKRRERSTLLSCSAILALLAATLPNILLEKVLVLEGIVCKRLLMRK